MVDHTLTVWNLGGILKLRTLTKVRPVITRLRVVLGVRDKGLVEHLPRACHADESRVGGSGVAG